MKFIRDVIGIDEPMLSVILGESLPPEAYETPSSNSALYTIPELASGEPGDGFGDDGWRDRLLQRIARELGQRRTPLLPPFANTPNVGAGAEVDVIPVEADQLGEAQSRLDCEQQQGVIAASEPRRAIRHGKYRLDLGARQEMHLPLVVPLVRYRQNPLNQSAMD